MSTINDLTEQEQRLIAADFAEHVLPLFETKYPDDDRPRKAIDAARAYARGEITKEQLAAASDAAWAAWATAGAASDAVWDASDATWAARDAAWDAAGAASDAAGAASDVAWDASDVAWAAAGAAAGAAWDAAGAAAMDAERAWQQQRIDEVVAARARP